MKLKFQHGLSFDSAMLLSQGQKLWLPLALPVRKTGHWRKKNGHSCSGCCAAR